MSRYCHIAASPNTLAERGRIDEMARAVDSLWIDETERAGRMSTEQARAKASELGLYAQQSWSCTRHKKSGRVLRVAVSCQLWVEKPYTIPGLGTGRSLSSGIYAKTWEEAFKLRRLRDIAFPATRARKSNTLA